MKTVKITLWTEWKPTLPDLVARHFPSYTIVRGLGGWVDQGGVAIQEESAQVILLIDPAIRARANYMATVIKEEHEQDAVFITTEAVTLEVV